MAVWALASIMDGTDNNHGMSDQIISIIQMQQAWVTVIMEQITLDTPLILQDIIKVIMDAQTITMTTPKVTEAEVGDEAAMVVVVVAMGTVPMNPTHNSSSPSNLVLASKEMGLLVRQDPSRLDPRQMPLPRLLLTSMSLVEKFAQNQRQKKIQLLKMRQRQTNKMATNLQKTEMVPRTHFQKEIPKL
jgi:hypothetical protein